MVSNVAVLVTSRSTIFDVLRVLHGDNSCKVYLKKERNLFSAQNVSLPNILSYLSSFLYQSFAVEYYTYNYRVHLPGIKIISFLNMHFSAGT